MKGGYAFVSQHIGDMENAETLENYERAIDLYKHMFRIEPRLIAYDLHPEYLSTKFAMGLDLPKIGVQHHHAHIVSVTAEHGIADPVVGIAFDGTGYGSDGHLWGGEVLLADWAGFERVAHLGRDAAGRRNRGNPAARAYGRRPPYTPTGCSITPASTLCAHVWRKVRNGSCSRWSTRTSTHRRLRPSADCSTPWPRSQESATMPRYEGQAAIELEAASDPSAQGTYEFALVEGLAGSPMVIDQRPVLESVLADVADSIPPGVIAARFHRAVIHCIVETGKVAASRAGTRDVALGGGVFMNRIILGGAARELTAAGLNPLTHVSLPMNDGAVSFGQAVVAWSNRHEA